MNANMNVEDKKRKRNVNFSKKEEELLIELVTKNKHILENKKTDAIMWKEKEQCWGRLVDEFNSQGLLVSGTAGQLQLKYKNLKKIVKKKSALIRFERQKTGGGIDKSTHLNDIENKVKEMIQLSVDGMLSYFDCDQENDIESSVFDDTNNITYADFDIDDSNYVTVMPDSFEDIPSTFIPINIPEQATIEKLHVPSNCETTNEVGGISTRFGSNGSQWNVVTPQNLNDIKSTPLRINKKHFKSRSAEATNLLQRKGHLVDLQIKCLEQEIEINYVLKRNVILKEKKMTLEIELLKTKLNSTKY